MLVEGLSSKHQTSSSQFRFIVTLSRYARENGCGGSYRKLAA
jgi:hypothetical protein